MRRKARQGNRLTRGRWSALCYLPRPMNLRSLTLLTCLFLCSNTGTAYSTESADKTVPSSVAEAENTDARPAPIPSASSLGITDTDEAVLVISEASGLRKISLGVRQLEVGPEQILVRNLAEGLLALTLENEEKTWTGSVRVYSGQVAAFNAGAALSSTQASLLGPAEFDLFNFYDTMDGLSSLTNKLDFCARTQRNLPPPPDDALVSDLCTRLQKQAELAEQERKQEDEEVDDDLSDELLDAPEEEEERRLNQLRKLYRADGRLRTNPPGTGVRLGLAGAGFAGAVVGVGAALQFEIQAEREYLLYRDAERIGDDPAMTQHLFVTKNFDRQRDIAIGIGTASLTGGLVAMLLQRLEAKRFKRYRASIEANEGQPNE